MWGICSSPNSHYSLFQSGPEARKIQNIQDTCWFCFSNPRLAKHLIVSIATKTYLALPQKGALASDHCMILPVEHLLSTLSIDEEVWEEIRVGHFFVQHGYLYMRDL